MRKVRFSARNGPISSSLRSRIAQYPAGIGYRDGFARDCLLRRRVYKLSVPERRTDRATPISTPTRPFIYSQITDWLDANCGAGGWALTPAGTRGVLNDEISVYFGDATLASAFVARWCVGSKVETAGGVFQVREDEPAPRIGAGLHRTP